MVSSGSTVTSDPVQVVLCSKFNQFTIFAKKGDAFKISVKAIDHVGNPLSARIHSSVVTKSGVGRLKEGQAVQKVSNMCTELEYNVFSLDNSAQVELYADGPCTNLGISKQTFSVFFSPLHMSNWISNISVPNRMCVCLQSGTETTQSYKVLSRNWNHPTGD